MRGLGAKHKKRISPLAKRLNFGKYDSHFKVVLDAIRELMMPPEEPKPAKRLCS
jgi:hypothetical protein